jgi:hypothetical protein
MVSAEASTAICVQRFDDSRNSAIHTTYRISLRSSSLREPRYPLLRVVFVSRSARPARISFRQTDWLGVWEKLADPAHGERSPGGPRARPPKWPQGPTRGVRLSSRVDVDGFNDPSAGSPHFFWSEGHILADGRARLAPCSTNPCLSELSGPYPFLSETTSR